MGNNNFDKTNFAYDKEAEAKKFYGCIDEKEQKTGNQEETKTKAIKNRKLFDLTEPEFYNYFTQEILPKTQKRDFKKIGCVYTVIAIILGFMIYNILHGIIGYFVMGSLMLSSPSSGNNNSVLIIIIPYLIGTLVVMLFILSKIWPIFKKFSSKKAVKNIAKKEVLQLLGFTYNETLRDNKNNEFSPFYSYSKLLKDTFFSLGKVPSIDEVIEGNYKDFSFVLMDLADDLDKYSHKVFLATKINKKITADILLRQKGNFIVNKFKDFLSSDEVVNLEDVAFCEEYQVFSKNQVEARFLLTPSFMERLLKYKKYKNSNVEVLFSNKNLYFGNIFFCVSTSKDMFELPSGDLNYISKNYKAFYNILQEIKDIMEIVESLKLDQDIGM
jgi:Protein of unknown function (DUF3137).